tara:strand:+ start:498 stop:773 length:276 start_codon:yes stop_codon:yes gene_type:complete
MKEYSIYGFGWASDEPAQSSEEPYRTLEEALAIESELYYSYYTKPMPPEEVERTREYLLEDQREYFFRTNIILPELKATLPEILDELDHTQ